MQKANAVNEEKIRQPEKELAAKKAKSVDSRMNKKTGVQGPL